MTARNDPYPRGMARPLRLCLPDGLYHLIARGNARQPIVADDHDRHDFFNVFAHVLERFGWLCHAFCLMDNHYHLVVETPLPNLPSGMRQLNGLYAQRFNRRHGRVGHLFQARYRSILIEKPTRLLAVCHYVVLNPVRGGHLPRSRRLALEQLPADCGPTKHCQARRRRRAARSARRRGRSGQSHYRRFVDEGLAAALEPGASGSARSRSCRSSLRPETRRRSRPPTGATATHCGRSASTWAATTRRPAGGCGARRLGCCNARPDPRFKRLGSRSLPSSG